MQGDWIEKKRRGKEKKGEERGKERNIRAKLRAGEKTFWRAFMCAAPTAAAVVICCRPENSVTTLHLACCHLLRTLPRVFYDAPCTKLLQGWYDDNPPTPPSLKQDAVSASTKPIMCYKCCQRQGWFGWIKLFLLQKHFPRRKKARVQLSYYKGRAPGLHARTC